MKNAKELLAGLSLEEKASLCSGKDFWMTKSIERLGIESFMLTDGPNGLRKQAIDSANVSLHESVPATCFPSGVGLASTWNKELLEEVGAAIGEEASTEGVGVVLGPAVNIKRSPLCGRNFDYFSEDPFLAGTLALHHINGLQSKGIGASIKHFAANNQEKDRMTSDSVLSERSLREIYLPAFEIAIKGSSPWTVMCAYNRINGIYCSENKWLLNDLLREEWGFKGVVITDWGACVDRIEGLRAGQDLQMPGSGGIEDAEIVSAVKEGKLSIEELDKTVLRILDLHMKVISGKTKTRSSDTADHHALARRVAGESMVLLKNEGILPLAKQGTLAFIGGFAKKPRYQGGGSSHIKPTRLDSVYEEAEKLLEGRAELGYAAGYPLRGDEIDESLLEEAKRLAAKADTAILFIGLTDDLESEGFDRKHIRIPRTHEALVKAVASVQSNVIVVLSNGAPVEMPWLSKARAVLEGYLAGQGGGRAMVDILFGEISPSGKLAETFPARLEDNPSFLNYASANHRVEYGEGIFVGYRHYDALNLTPLFPFGHGLSYASFEYSGLELQTHRLTAGETLNLSLKVKNTGKKQAKEVVQVYVAQETPPLPRPPKELKGFEKVELESGEEKRIEISLDARAFSCWDEVSQGWKIHPGNYDILTGSSSRDIRLSGRVLLVSADSRPPRVDINTTIGDICEHPAGGPFARKIVQLFIASFGVYDTDSAEYFMFDTQSRDMPIRNLVRMGGVMNPEQLEALIALCNGSGDPDLNASILQVFGGK